MNQRLVGVIWARVSTFDQRELSLDAQEEAVRRTLEAEGYEVPNWAVLKVDWTSLDLMSCPAFQELRKWIAQGKVKAVGTLDRDRLQAQGLQRLVFLSECQERQVKVVTVQGAPMSDGPEGQLVELALALGKERSVLRAQQGARDGLRARAVLKGLPPHLRGIYGMEWRDLQLVPDVNYPIAKDIWRMAMEGGKLYTICQELTRRAILSPKGYAAWGPNSVRAILQNRAYAGIVEALKTVSVEPRQRRVAGYGKTSRRRRPIEERIRLEGLVAVPIVSEAEFKWVQEQLAEHRRSASRNTQRTYLLQGMIRCRLCGRRYGGVYRHGHTYYYCRGRWARPWEGDRCGAQVFRATELEGEVFGTVAAFLQRPEVFVRELRRRQELSGESEKHLEEELGALQLQEQQEQEAEVRAFRMYTRGRVSDVLYEREIDRIRSRLASLREQSCKLREQLADSGLRLTSPEGVAALREAVASRLAEASDSNKRFVLESTGAQVIAHGDGAWDLELRVPRSDPHDGQTATSGPESNSPSSHS